MTPEQIARVCHEADRAYQQALGASDPHGPWDETSLGWRTAMIHHVQAVMAGTCNHPPDDAGREELTAAIVAVFAPGALPAHSAAVPGHLMCGKTLADIPGEQVAPTRELVTCPGCLDAVRQIEDAVAQQPAAANPERPIATAYVDVVPDLSRFRDELVTQLNEALAGIRLTVDCE